jgi:hypothetical protein
VGQCRGVRQRLHDRRRPVSSKAVPFSWEDFPSGGYNGAPPSVEFGLATTSGGSLASLTETNIPGQALPITPVLQAQDGTFIGTVAVGTPATPGFLATVTQTNMIAFDTSGKVKWSVPNDSPQIATADGGVIGASGTTYDSNGNATGQLGTLPTYAWTGDAYPQSQGVVTQVASTPPDVATSFWPGGDAQTPPGANASGTSTAFKSIVETLYVRSFAPWQWFGIEPPRTSVLTTVL